MIGLNARAILSTALAGSLVLAASASAQAHDEGRWERDRDYHHNHYVPEHRYHVGHPVHDHYVEGPRQVVYERQPVMVMPAPVYQAPAYSQPMNSSLNFNFTVPLR